MTTAPVSIRAHRAPDPLLEWPATGFDFRQLIDDGWTPSPFRQYLLKVTSRCNLDCDYCYVYHLADQSWRDKPRRISREVVLRTAERIGEHCAAHNLQSISVVFHGGEPLLLGQAYLSEIVAIIREALPEEIGVQFGIQTNATLIDDAAAAFLSSNKFGVGVSLDGTEEQNDSHRRDRRGRGSFSRAVGGLEILKKPEYRSCLAGLLATIDLRNDPLATYEELLSHGAPSIDFLLPHGTWASPPPGRDSDDATPYADWLIPVFDHWFHSKVKPVRMRYFEEIIHLLLGGTTSLELLGLEPVRLVVVESDGSIEQVDSLKAAYEGAASTGLDVFRHSFDEVLAMPGVAARQVGRKGLCATCLQCDLHSVCGGGLYSHRYRSGSGFLNPSVYCADLYRLIDHIRSALLDAVTSLGSRAVAP